MSSLPYFTVAPGKWVPGHVYRVVDADDRRLAESSDPHDDVMSAALANGGKLIRQHHFEPDRPTAWAPAEMPEPWTPRARKRDTEPAPQRPHTFVCICPHIYMLNHSTGEHEYRETLRIDACLAHDEGTTE